MCGVGKTGLTALGLALALLLAACGSSDATRILESDNISLRATISHYQSLDPTMTAQAADMAARMATMETDLSNAREQVKALTVQVNAGAQQPNQPQPPLATSDPGSFGTVPTPLPQPQVSAPGGQPNTGPVRAASGLTLERVVTARSKNASGCPTEETITFGTQDTQIFAIAEVTNFKRGTKFATTWSGGGSFEQRYEWVADYTGRQDCIHFFIEPGTLGLQPGTYSVVFAATDTAGETIQSPPIQFVIQ